MSDKRENPGNFKPVRSIKQGQMNKYKSRENKTAKNNPFPAIDIAKTPKKEIYDRRCERVFHNKLLNVGLYAFEVSNATIAKFDLKYQSIFPLSGRAPLWLHSTLQSVIISKRISPKYNYCWLK